MRKHGCWRPCLWPQYWLNAIVKILWHGRPDWFSSTQKKRLNTLMFFQPLTNICIRTQVIQLLNLFKAIYLSDLYLLRCWSRHFQQLTTTWRNQLLIRTTTHTFGFSTSEVTNTINTHTEHRIYFKQQIICQTTRTEVLIHFWFLVNQLQRKEQIK